jgi:hypothetical protein
MTFKIFTIGAALALAVTNASAQTTNAWLSAGTPAYDQAQYRVPYQDGRRVAYDNGYRDGLKRGEDAARANRPFSIERERDYRDAEGGYNRSYGDRNRYRDDYRGGFSQGYRDGYSRRSNGNYGYGNGNGNYGNGNYGYGNGNGNYGNGRYGNGNGGAYGGTYGYGAYQNGVADGYRKGLEDVQDRRSPDVTRHKWYRSGDHDYDNAYGSKDSYRIEYRRGFQDGYNRGFREGRRYLIIRGALPLGLPDTLSRVARSLLSQPQELLHSRHEGRRFDRRGLGGGLHLFQPCLPHHRGHADLLNRFGMDRANAPEQFGVDFHDDDVP